MSNITHVLTAYQTVIGTSGINVLTITVITWVIAGLCQPIAVFGVATNIINIVCFIKQGFSEPVNISLLGLAVSDLGCLVSQLLVSTFYTLEASTSDLTFEVLAVTYMTVAMPHLAFTRVSSWITVIITLERCLCITIPLKMKHIVTPKRGWIIVISVYVILIFSGAPVYAVNRLGITFSPAKNRTLLRLVSSQFKDKVEGITFTINSFLLPFAAFIIIIICTAILVVKLRKRTKWIKTSVTASQVTISNRDQKVAKMVVMISVIFIVCFVPLAAIMLALAFIPDLNVGGKLFNIGKLFGNVALLMESVNSSANIFIYHYMSQKYRETLSVILCKFVLNLSGKNKQRIE